MRLGLNEPLPPVAWDATPPPPACSYNPGGSDVGIKESCPDIDA